MPKASPRFRLLGSALLVGSIGGLAIVSPFVRASDRSSAVSASPGSAAAPLPVSAHSRLEAPPELPASRRPLHPWYQFRERPAAGPNDPVEVLVELNDPPALELYAKLKSGREAVGTQGIRRLQRYLGQIHRAQQALADVLTGSPFHATIYARAQRVFNGMAVQVQAGKLSDIRALPGVKAVHVLPPWALAQADPITPPTASPQERSGFAPLWEQVGAGSGVRVGVIDTGIDYTHAALGGAGETAAYAANNPAVVEPGTFPTAKVVAGKDFVGDNYNLASNDPSQRVARPDDDPLDRNGHGSFVSSVVAGVGVLENGARYQGAYDARTFEQRFKVPPGGAPQATLLAAKVGGANNLLTDPAVIVAAFDWLVDPDGNGDPADAVDLINMSLASFFVMSDHPVNRAIQNANQAGVLTTKAVGNAGDTFHIAGVGLGLDVAGSTGGAPAAAGVGGQRFSIAALLDDKLAPTSSRGGGGRNVTPEAAARNTSIGAAAGTGSDATTVGGTSGAAALVAAFFAIVIAAEFDLPPELVFLVILKAFVMNSADLLADNVEPPTGPEVQAVRRRATDENLFRANATLPFYGPTRAGAGQLNVAAALNLPAFIFGAATDLPQISFGTIEALSPAPQTASQDWYVVNRGSTTLSLQVSLVPTAEMPGVEVGLFAADGSRLTQLQVPPNGRATGSLRLALDPRAMKHTHDPTLAEAHSGTPRHWLSEVAGYIRFTVGGAGTAAVAQSRLLHLPYYATVRPTADMSTTQTALNLPGAMGSVDLNLVGQGVHTGNSFPGDTIAMVTPLELQEISPNDPLTSGSDDHSDLKAIGVASNLGSQSTAAVQRIYFGIATHRDWRTPNQVTVSILIDTNRDGTPDFQLLNTSLPNEVGAPGDAFITGLRNLRTGAVSSQGFLNLFSAAQFNTVPFNTNVMVLPVSAAALDLTPANARFDYQVQTMLNGVVVDQSQRLTYDAARPGLDFGPNPTLFDLPGQRLTAQYNRANLQANRSLGALLLHHHNASGKHDQVLRTN